MRAAVAVSLSLCWLWAAGHSLPRLRLSYRGEPGRGHLLRDGTGRGGGLSIEGRGVLRVPAPGPGEDSGRCARSAEGFF